MGLMILPSLAAPLYIQPEVGVGIIRSLTMRKLTIQAMQQLAEQHGGRCLSNVCVSSRSKLTWQCAQAHVFETTPKQVKLGRWCRICGCERAGVQRRFTMAEIHALATARKGRCLSETYAPGQKLQWQCEHGHVWGALISNVKKGRWCPVCRHLKDRLTIEEMRDIAGSHRGRCLSTSYLGSGSKLQWECSERHTWFAPPSTVKAGHWCPECAGMKKHEIEDAQELARERGGECLSDEYHSSKRKLKWRCSEGHSWMTSYNYVDSGNWCPECSAGLGERICRAYFEQMFGRHFPKTRPGWLINSDGNQMELDGYCEDISLAFEHQGQQHYRDIDFFHSEGQFEKRKGDDRRKKTLCLRHGITLIEVLEIPTVLPLPRVQQYIIEQCAAQGVAVPEAAASVTVKLLKAYSPDARERIEAIQKMASMRGGRCLSPTYLGQTIPLRFRCSVGHEWETKPPVVMKGHWCPVCAATERGHTRRSGLPEMQAIAVSRGGRCLSDDYVNNSTHLLWQCKEGHQWKANPHNVKSGSWCPVCAGKGRTIEDMKNLAARHGGQCLSAVYKDTHTKLLWQCQAGHRWETTPHQVRIGRWCPVCGHRRAWERRRGR